VARLLSTNFGIFDRDSPVIFWRLTDPVGFRLIESLAQPGGNLTGFSRAIEKLTVKRLELLHEMLPRVRRIGFVWIEDFDHHRQQAMEVRQAGENLTLTSYTLPSADWTAERLDAVFANMRKDPRRCFFRTSIFSPNY
jgi:putative ABC transport system substrate-binding protein